MSESEDLKQLLFTFKRIAGALEDSSASAGHQVRHGRGGNSNGVGVSGGGGSFDYGKEALNKSVKAVSLSLQRESDARDKWVNSIRKAAGINEVFGERLKTTIERIDAHNKEQDGATRLITSNTVRLSKQYGVNNATLKAANEGSIKYVETMGKLIAAHEKRKYIEDIDVKISEAAVARKKLNARRDKEAIEVLDKQISEMKALKKTLPEVQEEIRALQDEMVGARVSAGNLAPALDAVSDSTKEVVDSFGQEIIEVDKLTSAYRELNPNVKAQINTYRRLNEDLLEFRKKVQDAADGIGNALLSIAKGLGTATVTAIDNFREQLKYNVKESNYFDAGTMGLSDGELSKALGENADAFRSMTGSGNTSAILDGTLQQLQKTVTSLYGEAGPEAMQRIAQMTAATQSSGFNTRNNPQLVENRLKDYSAMADRLGMVKGQLVDFSAELAASGDMAYMAGKYQHMTAENARAAMDKELEARIANAKMLGLGTDHIKKQIQLERANRYGTLEHQIKNMIGGKMDASIARKNGVAVSPEMEAIIQKQALGQRLTEDEARKMDTYALASQNAMNAGMDTATARGDTSGYLGYAAQRQIAGAFGSNIYSSEGMQQAEAQRAAIRGKFTQEEWADFERTGKVAEIYQQNGASAADPNAFNSSLLIGDQFMNSMKTLYDGFMKNPLLQLINAGVWGIVANTAKMAWFSSQGNGMLDGFGDGDVDGGRKRRKRNRRIRRLRARSPLGRATRGIGALLNRGGMFGRSAVGAVATPGRAALGGLGMRAAGGLAGGLASGGLGLLAAGVEMGGDSWKQNALASGAATNDTILDGDTGGAMLSTLGSAGQGALTGAMIGSIIPGIGTAVGAAVGGVIGAGMGAWDNRDTIMRNYETVMGASPAAKLEEAQKEAAKVAEERANVPTMVQLVGPEADAIRSSSIESTRIAEHTKQQLGEAKKANEFQKSSADIKAMFEAQRANVSATQQRFAGMEGT